MHHGRERRWWVKPRVVADVTAAIAVIVKIWFIVVAVFIGDFL